MSAPQPQPDAEQPRTPPAARRWSLAGAATRGCLLGLLVCLAVELVNLVFNTNLHVVIPGAVYRSGQPGGADLERLVRRHGIRTVVNLRGCCEDLGWFREECRAANRLGVSVESLGLSAGHLPPVGEIRRLVEILDHAEYPILFHCFRGVDRTGLASAVALLLKTDATLRQARHALSLRFVHLRWGRTGQLDRFFDLYQEWLAGRPHTAQLFRTWLLHGYCGGACSCRLAVAGPVLVGPSATPMPAEGGRLRVPRGVSFAVPVRCRNTSVRPWHFSPDLSAGFHGSWMLFDDRRACLAMGKAGRYRADVAPGGTIVLTFVVPAIHLPGRHVLQFDLIEEQHCFFHEAGSEPLEVEVDVQ